MFVGCSEINIVVIVKHVQNIEIVRAFYLPRGACSVFQCLGGQKKLLNCGLLVTFGTQADTMVYWVYFM